MNTMESVENVCREIVTKERLYERLNNAIRGLRNDHYERRNKT